MTEVLLLLLALALTLACAVFVAAEFSLTTIERGELERAAQAGERGAVSALKAAKRLTFQLSGVQLGITVTSLVIGMLAEPSLAVLLRGPLEAAGLPAGAVSTVATLRGVAVSAVVLMVVGELVPKNWAISSPLAVAKVVAGPQRVFTVAFGPLIHHLNTANRLVRRFGLEPAEELASARTPQELVALAQHSAREGAIEQDSAELFVRTLHPGELTAQNVMTPRVDVQALEARATAADAANLTLATGLSRFPVCRDTLDEVIGTVHIRDVLALDEAERGRTPVADLATEPLLVPDCLPWTGCSSSCAQRDGRGDRRVRRHGRREWPPSRTSSRKSSGRCATSTIRTNAPASPPASRRTTATRSGEGGRQRPPGPAPGDRLPGARRPVRDTRRPHRHAPGAHSGPCRPARRGRLEARRPRCRAPPGGPGPHRRTRAGVGHRSRARSRVRVRGADRGRSPMTALQLAIGALTLITNAFFVGAESALISVRRSQIEPRAVSGSRRARSTLWGIEHLSAVTATAQLGITLSSLVLGAVAEPAIAHLLEPPFEAVGVPEALIHPIAFVIALTLATYLHMLVGEMAPKNIALAAPVASAPALAPALVALTTPCGRSSSAAARSPTRCRACSGSGRRARSPPSSPTTTRPPGQGLQ